MQTINLPHPSSDQQFYEGLIITTTWSSDSEVIYLKPLKINQNQLILNNLYVCTSIPTFGKNCLSIWQNIIRYQILLIRSLEMWSGNEVCQQKLIY